MLHFIIQAGCMLSSWFRIQIECSKLMRLLRSLGIAFGSGLLIYWTSTLLTNQIPKLSAMLAICPLHCTSDASCFFRSNGVAHDARDSQPSFKLPHTRNKQSLERRHGDFVLGAPVLNVYELEVRVAAHREPEKHNGGSFQVRVFVDITAQACLIYDASVYAYFKGFQTSVNSDG